MKGGRIMGYIKREMKGAAKRSQGIEQQRRWAEIEETFRKAQESVREYEKQKK